MVDVLEHPDAASGNAHLSNALYPPLPMASGYNSDGGLSLSRQPRTRKLSRRKGDSSSDPLTSSGEGEVSSGRLFVRLPSTNAQQTSFPRSPIDIEHQQTQVDAKQHRTHRRHQLVHAHSDRELSVENPSWTARLRTLSSGATQSRPNFDARRGRQASSENGEGSRGTRPRVLSLPRQAFRSGSHSDCSSEQASPLTPSAFNDIPPMPVFARHRYRHQPRDSGNTHQSTTSSSLYPRSSSTGTGTDSYSAPPSLPPNDIDDRHIITVDPEDSHRVHDLHDMDTDDVSYRLRLLMQNNYYLPPAHSKPFKDTYLSPDSPKKLQSKPSSPNFLDIFKVGKRAKAACSPDAKNARGGPAAPILRTTSDSSTVSGMLKPQTTRIPVQQNVMAASSPRQDKGRVVVVRERMEDIVAVAKQVEQDLKQREAERRANASESSSSYEEPAIDGLIDPTDCVDLPPVAANTLLFGPQASALNGLGVESSVGAAMLADHLPPHSPGMWSVDSEEEAWRKALLQEAVGHSLNNSPAVTPAVTPARSPSASSPFLSLEVPQTPSPVPPLPRSNSSVHSAGSPRPTPSPPDAEPHTTAPEQGEISEDRLKGIARRKRDLGQRILSQMIDEDELDQLVPPHSPHPTIRTDEGQDPGQQQASSSKDLSHKNLSLRVTSSGSYIPIRAETPTVPPQPLAPPPRRTNLSPGYLSDSQDHDSILFESARSPDDGTASLLTTRLVDTYESHVGIAGPFGTLTPPLITSQHNSATLSAVIVGSQVSGDGSTRPHATSISSGSHYSDDDQDDTAFHTPLEHTEQFDASRPSLTVSLAPSFRTSSEYSQPSPTSSAFGDAMDHSPYPGNSPRHSIVNTLGRGSRISSRMSDFQDPRYSAVSPPPRTSSSLAHNILHPPPLRRTYVPPMSFETGPREFDNITERSHTPHAEPTTPTGRLHPPAPLALRDLQDPALASSSYPPSPISFFDTVEMQSQADGDESSDDEEQVATEEQADQSSGQISGYQSDAGMVIIDPMTKSVANIARDHKQPLGTGFMQLKNHSTPQLASGSSHRETSSTLTHDVLAKRRGTDAAPPSASSRSTFSFGKKQEKSRDATPQRIGESMLSKLKHKASIPPGSSKRPKTSVDRPSTADSNRLQAWTSEQNVQDHSMRRLDGMLIEHMERERDILRRITTTLSKP